MSLNLPNFFKNKGYLEDVKTYQISLIDFRTATCALNSDIDAFFINGLISIASAITSLNKSNFSWAFIQSYYAIFYLARAFNGTRGYAIVYKDRTPYGIKLQPSEKFTKLKGNSHDVVLSQFKNNFSHDTLIANDIDDISPIDWFNKKRNFINYTLNPLTDPSPPISLYEYKDDLRKWITTYSNDTEHIYTFDPKHCYISYPLQLLNRVFNYYIENDVYNRYLNDDKMLYLKKNISDEKGPITALTVKIQELYE